MPQPPKDRTGLGLKILRGWRKEAVRRIRGRLAVRPRNECDQHRVPAVLVRWLFDISQNGVCARQTGAKMMFHLSELQALASKFDPVSLAANEAERAVDAIVSDDVSRAQKGLCGALPPNLGEPGWLRHEG